jgi:sugar lactone lactonase YvrE
LRLFETFVLSVALISSSFGQSYTIQTFAGGGILPNGPATTANLGSIYGLGVDSSGNVYMALGTYAIVMRLDTSGNLTRIAGTGVPGFSGDGGPATAAQLGLSGIAVDTAGDVFIADAGNNRVRRIDAVSGQITTVAGNGTTTYTGDGVPATATGINYPGSVAVDGPGNLYISSPFSDAVWKVAATTGLITTVAGKPGQPGTQGAANGDSGPATSAFLVSPMGIALDSSGNLYIVEEVNADVRRVDAVTGIITTVAGTRVAGNSGDGGPATAAQFNYPTGIAVDSEGDLFIADWNNAKIRRVDGSTGIITTVGGPVGAYAVAVDAAGTAVYSGAANIVSKMASGVTTTVAGGGSAIGDGGSAVGALMGSITGVAVGPSGVVYIADVQNNRVRSVSNGVIATFAGDGGWSNSGNAGDGGPATSAQLRFSPGGGIGLDGAGNLYIAEYWDIRKVSASTGVITTFAGQPPSDPSCNTYLDNDVPALGSCILWATGLAVDAPGNLYFPQGSLGLIRKVTAATGSISTYAGIAGGANETGDGGPALSAQLNNPSGMATDAAGNLFFADTNNSRVRKIDASTGIITTVAGTGQGGGGRGFSGDGGPAVRAALFAPQAVAVDGSGNVFIADWGNNRIRRVDAASQTITTIAGSGSAGFSGDNGDALAAVIGHPVAIAAGSDGRVYFTDGRRVRVLIPSGGTCTYTVSPLAPASVAAAGGNVQITIQTGPTCTWTVSGLPAWITLSGASSGTGPATVTLVVAANTGAALSANVTVAGQIVAVSEAAAAASTCTYSVSPLAPPAVPAAGGLVAVTIRTDAGCSWTITGVPSWITLVGSASGSGPVSVNFLIAPNSGAANQASISVAGSEVAISQSGVGTAPVLSAVGSLAQIASGGGWSTSLTLLNLGATSAEARVDLRGDDGNAMPLPLVYPQLSAGGSQTGSTIDQTINPGAQLIVNSSASANASTGWAQLSTTGDVSGFAIFEDLLTNYQAVVPLETRNAPSYVLAFDNTGGVATGLAIANPSPLTATIPVVVRDESGQQIASGNLPLASQGHTSFMLTDTQHGGYAQTAGKRGTVEFDTPSGGQISVLGLRANNGKALTTLPVLAQVGNGGGMIAHIAFGAGWQTLLTLVNTGATQAQVSLNYFDDNGNKLSVPMFEPASGATNSATTVSESLAPGASLLIQSQGAEDAAQTSTGWAQLTTTGNVSGFAVFQIEKTLQEAVVPLESRQAGAYVLAFDNSGGLGTGLAIANASSQTATIPTVVRNDAGQQIASGNLVVMAHGHTSFMLTDIGHGGYSQAAGERGTIEFDTPAGGQISVLGIRATAAGIITTIPALAK